MGQAADDLRKAISVMLDGDLLAAVNAERARLTEATGLKVSMNQVATLTMRAGLETLAKR